MAGRSRSGMTARSIGAGLGFQARVNAGVLRRRGMGLSQALKRGWELARKGKWLR